MDSQRIEALRRTFDGPMSAAEVTFLRDVQGLIEHAIRNGLSFPMVISALGHDINGVVRYGCELEQARSEHFKPKSEGFSRIDADSVGESDESLD